MYFFFHSGVPDTLAGNSSQHPADPEINDDLIDTNLLNEILAFGFEKAIAVLALTKTKGLSISTLFFA